MIFRHRISRVQPVGPPIAYRTFGYHPFWRKASCAEVDCDHYLHGWVTPVDETTELGARQAYYIRHHAHRGFVERRAEDGRTLFVFSPGQRCFSSDTHRVVAEREPRWVVRDGDWRGNPTGWGRLHKRGSLWVEEWAENQDRLRTLQQRG